MAKGQKEAVIEEVKLALGSAFVPYTTNAILVLSSQQLENIKANIFNGIINGLIEYGKDPSNHSEARTYARSMVMNHLKKAKELNGGHTYQTSSAPGTPKTVRVKAKLGPKGVNMDILPDELKEFAKTLV